MCGTCKLIEVYKTTSGCVYQCNNKNCLWINYAGESIPYKIDQFFHLKSIVDSIDIDKMINCTEKASDLAIIAPLTSSKIYILNLCELLSFKELLSGTKVMLELNSIVYERLYSIAI
ncbi:MAG: hypothetical protein M3512_06125 [Bacteroidota bacterium]|nr:hypothetical protein [Bacteroidota bacterium]